MIWYLFIIYIVSIAFFLKIGTAFSKKLYIQVAALLLVAMGITILGSGIDIPIGWF